MQKQYFGSEAIGYIMVTLGLAGGTSNITFNITITPLEQSTVSAQGNCITVVVLCVDWRVFD